MQISIQLSSAPSKVGIFFVCASLLLLFPASLHCDPYASAWSFGPKSSVRLIAAAGSLVQAAYRAGIEIQLEPNALTYWRMPGAAGVPPEFSFEGSINAGEIAVSYPAPTRINEDGTEVFGYRNHVTFPIRVTPKDPSRPVVLALSASYAVCARICLPAKGEASLTLAPGVKPKTSVLDPEEAVIAAAEASVPVRLAAHEARAKVAITRLQTEPLPTWLVSLRNGRAQDLFAEAPSGWYFETRKSAQANEFLVVEVEKPSADELKHPLVTLTVKDEEQSYELMTDLAAAASVTAGSQGKPRAISQADQD